MLKVLFLVLRQMHDTGHACHTHECGDRYFLNISKALPVAGEGCPHHKYLLRNTASRCQCYGCRVASSPSDEERSVSWVSALQLRSSALPYVTIVAAYSMAGRGLFRNAPFLVQKQGKLPGGERCGLRQSSRAAWSSNFRRKNTQRLHSGACFVFSFPC